MKTNSEWWRRIYPATKTDIRGLRSNLNSNLNQIAFNLHQIKQLVVSNAIISNTFPSADLQNKIRALLRLIQPVKINEVDKIRVGSEADGGYIQLGDFKRLSLALSLGIGDNDDWDLATAKRGIPVKQF